MNIDPSTFKYGRVLYLINIMKFNISTYCYVCSNYSCIDSLTITYHINLADFFNDEMYSNNIVLHKGDF